MARSVKTKTTATTGLDINFISNVTLSPTEPVRTGFDSATTKSAGMMKSANMFYKILFTDVGSNPMAPNEGTAMSQVFTSSISDEEVLYAFVSEQIDAAIAQLKAYQSAAGTPNPDRVSAALISKFLINNDDKSLVCNVTLYNPDGETVDLQLPSIVVT